MIHTIKDSERRLRQNKLPISNVFMKSEDKCPSCKYFHALLSKAENKFSFKKHSWEQQNQPLLRPSTVVGRTTKNLSTRSLMPELNCAHAEADMAMFTIYIVLRSESESVSHSSYSDSAGDSEADMWILV